MSFDAREKSQHGGQPVECYRFSRGIQVWRLTSAERAVTLPTGLYEPAPVARGELDLSQEHEAGALEVTLPVAHPIAQLFAVHVPTQLLQLTVFRAHRGEESAPVAWFAGSAAAAEFQDSQLQLTFLPLDGVFRRPIPALRYQSQCNWALYGPGCGVARAAFRDAAVVSAVNGAAVTAAAFGARANGWYTNGWLEDGAGEIRFIVDHVGSVVTLMYPFASLPVGAAVSAYAGCDRTEATCAAKFNNLANHLGFPRIPTRNPHVGGIV